MPPAKKPKTRDPANKKVPVQALSVIPVGAVPAVSVTQQGEASALFGTIEMKKGDVFDRKKEIAALAQQVNKQFKGGAVIREGSNINNVFVLRRPSGVTSLDLAVGGGLPAGGLTQVIGKFSAGKSYLCNLIMAEAQRNYGEDFAAAVCMTEQRYDKKFAKEKCGLRVAFSDDEIEVILRGYRENGYPDFEFTPEHIAWFKDQVGTFTETLGATAEQLLEVAVQQVESNLFQIVLIDSFGALLTKAEAEHEEGLEGKHRGGAAMVVTQFMHRLHAALNLPDKYGRPNTTTVIGINQYRDNVNAGLYGNPMKIAGGHALAHGQLVNIHIEQGSKIRVAFGNENRIVGKEINWEIMKGKAGCHDGMKGTYKLFLGEYGYPFGIDKYSDLLACALNAGVVEQSGAWYGYKGEKIGQGADNACLFLSQHLDIYQDIRKEVLRLSKLNFIVRETA